MSYQIIETSLGNKILIRYDGEDIITSIPMDESNSDYQAYLKYLAKQNEGIK